MAGYPSSRVAVLAPVLVVLLLLPGMAMAFDGETLMKSMSILLEEFWLKLMLFIASILMNLVLAVMIFQAAVADVMVMVALAFGPLIVMLFPILPGMTHRLFEFTLGAIGIKVVAVIMTDLMAGIYKNAGDIALASMQAGEGLPTAKNALGMLVMGFFLLFFAMRVSDIAAGLFGGLSLGMMKMPMKIGGKMPNFGRGR